MIPIIFDKSEPAKGNDAFNSNGLGRLRDAISCNVTKSLDGSQYDLEMEYPVNGVHYDDIKEKNYIYASVSHKYDPQPFRIVKVSKPIKGTVNITANHISYILKKTLIRPYAGPTSIDANYRFRIYQGDSLQTVLDRMVSVVSGTDGSGVELGSYIQPSRNNLFNFTTNVTVPAGSYYNPYTKTWETNTSGWGNGYDYDRQCPYYEIDKPITVQEFITGSDENSINSIFGFKEENNTQLEYVFDGFTIGLMTSVGVETGTEIRYGKNMTDMTYDTDHEEMYGQSIAYYSGSRVATTIISPVTEDMGDKSDAFGEISLMDLSSDEAYGAYLDNNDDTENQMPTPGNAKAWAEAMMKEDNTWLSKTNVNVSFIDLWKTEEYKDVAPMQLLDLGDTVTVVHPDFDIRVTKRIQNESWDSLVDRYTSMTLGDLRKDIKDVILEDVEQYIGVLTEYVEETFTYYSSEIAKQADEIALRVTETEMYSNLNSVKSELQSEIDLKPDTISLTVNGNNSGTISSGESGKVGITITMLDEYGNVVDSGTGYIYLDGNVIFKSNLTDGTTQINGGNIITNSISLDKLNASVITVGNVDDYIEDYVSDEGYLTDYDVGQYGNTKIDGGRILTGLISADRINTKDLVVRRLITDYDSSGYNYIDITNGVMQFYDSVNTEPDGHITGGYGVIRSNGNIVGYTKIVHIESMGDLYIVAKENISLDGSYTININSDGSVGLFANQNIHISAANGYINLNTTDLRINTGISTTTSAPNLFMDTSTSRVYRSTAIPLTSHQDISSFSFSGKTLTLTLSGGSSKSVTFGSAAGIDRATSSTKLTSDTSEIPNGACVVNYVTNTFKGFNDTYQNDSNKNTTASYFCHSIQRRDGYNNILEWERYKVNTSDRRLKVNITPIEDFTKLYMELEPISYSYNPILKGYALRDHVHYGLVAQDVIELYDKYGMDSSNIALCCKEYELDEKERMLVGDDWHWVMKAENLHALHIQMIQKQQHEIESLKSELLGLRGEIEILKQMIKEEIQNGIN